MSVTDDGGVLTTAVLATTVAIGGAGTTDAMKPGIACDVEGAPSSGFFEVNTCAAGVAAT
jgi:hypothetical protein